MTTDSPETTVFVPITDIKALRAAGILSPATIDGWRWLFRKRKERGLARAFRRNGRKIEVDVPAYIEAKRQQPAA